MLRAGLRCRLDYSRNVKILWLTGYMATEVKLNETRASNEPMLNVSKEGHHLCVCNYLTEQQNEINGIKSKYKKQENKIRERDQTILKLSNDIAYIKERLNLIENLLLPKVTDSKIRIDVVRNKVSGMVHGRESSVVWYGKTDSVDDAAKNITEAETNTEQYRHGPVETTHEVKQCFTVHQNSLGTDIPQITRLTVNDTVNSGTELSERQIEGKQTGREDTAKKEEVVDSKGAVGGSDSYRGNIHKYRSSDTVSKANFLKPQQPEASVVKQDVKLVHDGEMLWRLVSQMEMRRNFHLFQDLEDIHVVICLDISESMAQSNGWTEAHTFLTDYLKGLANISKAHDLKTEHVAFITFGHETKIQMEYTNQYDEVRGKLDRLKCGGPTQMFGGILLADAVAFCTRHHIECLSNGANILTKIIIVTDGRTTELDLIAGPDIQDTTKVDETKAKILQEMEDFRRTQRDVFFVPVGSSDLDFLNTMVTCSDGMLLDFRLGKRFSRRQYLTKQLLDPFGIITDILTSGLDTSLSTEDKEDMRNIQERAKRHIEEHGTITDGRNKYGDIKSKQLPSVGSRVRRGPDWRYGNQDKNGPGTLIGQCDNDQQVWVEWDTDAHQNVYHYGLGGYDILVVDEPRKLKPGEQIAVGCEVKQGKDWKSSEGQMNQGVVIKIDKRNKTAMVRWNNGKRGDYSYGDDRLQEIEIKRRLPNSGNSRLPADTSFAPSSEWEPPPAITIEEFAAKKAKNKNKNIR